MISKKVLDLIVCPQCKDNPECTGKLQLVSDKLICHHNKIYYPIRDGIPILLVEEALALE